jgi:hypothetical protein
MAWRGLAWHGMICQGLLCPQPENMAGGGFPADQFPLTVGSGSILLYRSARCWPVLTHPQAAMPVQARRGGFSGLITVRP